MTVVSVETIEQLARDIANLPDHSEGRVRAALTAALRPASLPDASTQDPLCIIYDGNNDLYYFGPTSILHDWPSKNAGFKPFVISITFTPEQWQNDYAVAIEPMGDTVFDATHLFLTDFLQEAMATDMNAATEYGDRFLESHNTPEWMKDHSGPFTCSWNELDVDDLIEAAKDQRLMAIC